MEHKRAIALTGLVIAVSLESETETTVQRKFVASTSINKNQ